MAEEGKEDLPAGAAPQALPPSFLVVTCTSTGKERRFAAGTAAGFAVSLINKRLETGSPVALYIEAVKAGEEPIAFGPNAVLVDYGSEWKLQTVTDINHQGGAKSGRSHPKITEIPDSRHGGSRTRKDTTKHTISFVYVGKILLAFIFMFVLGAILTLALEYLPILISAMNSFM